MRTSELSVMSFKIAWNNSGVNTVCPICGDRTEPSINFQVQTQDGDAICETCLIEQATDLAEVLYAYFTYKYPHDDMSKMFLAEIKQQQLVSITKPKTISPHVLDDLREATNGVIVKVLVMRENSNVADDTVMKKFLVTKKWLAVNEPAYAENLNKDRDYLTKSFDLMDLTKGNYLYEKALDEGAVIAETLVV